MMSIILVLIQFFTTSSSNLNATVRADVLCDSAWIPIKIEGRNIYFSNNRSISTKLYNLKYIAQLKTNYNEPYLVVSGRSCEECDENISLYLISLNKDLLNKRPRPYRYSYPGKEYQYDSKKLVFESRVFIGECIEGKPNSIIWFQKKTTKSGEGIYSVFLIEVINSEIKETYFERHLPSIENTIVLASQSKCFELEGIDQYTEP